MHLKVKQLANHFGVQIADRLCYSVERGLPEDFRPQYALYDGKSIATRIRLWDKTVHEKDDHSLMHEIAHYAVASEEQRGLPEFGLGTPAYGQPLGCTESWGYIPSIPSAVEKEESDIQEHMAQMLCVLWGKSLGISPLMIESPDWNLSWDDYFHLKTYRETLDIAEKNTVLGQERLLIVWQALIRLNDNSMLRCPIS
jgi:hypothetical protein